MQEEAIKDAEKVIRKVQFITRLDHFDIAMAIFFENMNMRWNS